MSGEDKRELILARLLEVAQTVVEPNCAFRNQLDIPETRRPAIVILDADEQTDDSAFGRKRPCNGPLIVAAAPEIFILAESKPANIGAVLNGLRRRFLKAVLHDESLVALCTDGDIRYEGFTTGLAVGRSMEGECGVNLTFRYTLRPDRL